MTMTVTDVRKIPAIGHAEAMALAQAEAERLLDVVDQLTEDDWSRPTDCDGWDVKALLSHVLGAFEGNARAREFFRLYRYAVREAKRSGKPMIDEMTAIQVHERAQQTHAELARRLHEVAPAAVRGRRRFPAVVRTLPFKPGEPFGGTWTMGYLVDVIMGRDNWMHRIDLTRATDLELVLTPEHDGRIVADVVAEWARRHGQPFHLVLDGPAGGTYSQGDGNGDDGEPLELDAIRFCRVLSGRDTGPGLLSTEVPF
jgi:uncharacterized protein (TIGR03083 family)